MEVDTLSEEDSQPSVSDPDLSIKHPLQHR